MPSIAITGGIATGKSTVTAILTQIFQDVRDEDVTKSDETRIGFIEKFQTTTFYADQEIGNLLDHHPEVAQEITAAFGPAVYHGQKKANRVYLRTCLIKDPKSKQKLEAILHPRLRKQWLPQAKKAQGKPSSLFLAEIPLLYENDLSGYFDHVIVVGASTKVQLHRLITQRKLPADVASSLLKLQLPLLEKMNRADQVVWNEGSMTILHEQLQTAAFSILQRQHLFLSHS